MCPSVGTKVTLLSWSFGSWISHYKCNQCLSPLTLFWIQLMAMCTKIEGTKGVIIIRNAKKERQRSGQKKKDKPTNNDLWNGKQITKDKGRRLSQGTPDSSTTKTGRHDFAEILLKVTLNTTNHPKSTDYLYSRLTTHALEPGKRKASFANDWQLVLYLTTT
jgi:hypothetical protein